MIRAEEPDRIPLISKPRASGDDPEGASAAGATMA